MSYREKYIKYKNKYLILKNNFLGAGENGRIEFFKALKTNPLKTNPLEKKKLPVTIDSIIDKDNPYKLFLNSLIDLSDSSSDKSLFIVLTKDNGEQVQFQIERYLNKGGNSMVFKTVDNKIIKISLYTGSKLNYEGKITEELEIEPIMKALYQGNSEIDFVIYNYLGEPVQDVIKKKNDLSFLFHIFNNLFIQIDKLNSRGYFHNDIKIQNSVILEDNIYLIDFELIQKFSYKGSYQSLCLCGCVINIFNNFRSKYDELKIDSFSQYLVNTDIIGFFNFIINCLFIHYKISTNIFDLMDSLLNLDKNYLLNDIIKMMCFLSILSYNIIPYKKLMENQECKTIILEIEAKLMKQKIANTFGIELNEDNKGFLCYTCYIYTSLKFTTENQFKFLYELIKNCFLSSFNLQTFKENIGTILEQRMLI